MVWLLEIHRDGIGGQRDTVSVSQLVADQRNGPVSSEATMPDEGEDIPADEPTGQSDGEFSGGAEGTRARGTGGVGTVCEAAAQFEGMLEGVDVADPVVADVQPTATLVTAVLLDIEDQVMEVRIFGPAETHRIPPG